MRQRDRITRMSRTWSKRSADKVEGAVSRRNRERHALESVNCRVANGVCSAKHVSVMQRTGLLHPLNESRRVQALLGLQQRYGNRFVQQVIGLRNVQAKLRIGQPGDIYEQEADRVAKQVMQMPEVRRQSQDEEEEKKELQAKKKPGQDLSVSGGMELHRRPIEEEEEELRMNRAAGQAKKVSPKLESRINAASSGGQRLHAYTRTFFEPRFGYDFSRVRIHTSTEADTLSRRLNARSFTIGHDVFFRRGEYNPDTSKGRELLAHELTHVLQQRVRAGERPQLISRKEQNPFKGLSTEETVDYRAEALVDAALEESDLWPYIGDKVERGVRVEGGITYLRGKDFEEAYIAHARRRGEAIEKAKEVGGFYDPVRDRITLRVPANLGSMLHEAMHKFSDPSFRQVFRLKFDDAVTQYFTNFVLKEYRLPPGKAYAERVPAAEALSDAVGFEELALGYFLGPAINVLKALLSRGVQANDFLNAIRQDTVDWPRVADMIRGSP